jgi:hypothetical protein
MSPRKNIGNPCFDAKYAAVLAKKESEGDKLKGLYDEKRELFAQIQRMGQ